MIEHKAKNFLFPAYVFGRLNLWTVALEVAEVWRDAPALEVAEAYLRRVVEEFKATARNDAPDTPLGGWPNIRDT